MHPHSEQNRRLRFEPLEARLVLSCDFTGDGVCDVDDLDALYEASDFSVTASVQPVDFSAWEADPKLNRQTVSYDLFVTSTADIALIQGSVTLEEPHPFLDPEMMLFQHPFGSNVAPPSTALFELYPSIRADSWIRTPGDSVSLAGSFDEVGFNGVVADSVDSGAVQKFHFARFTVVPDEFVFETRFHFEGSATTVAADGTARSHSFTIELPGLANSRFNFDKDTTIDGRDIPGWLASASVHDPNNNTFRMGDINLDGNVDSQDLGVLLNNFSSTDEPSSDVGWGDGDLNMSGTIDQVDLGLVLNNFGFESLASFASLSRAAEAIDAFAVDLYAELQKEEGNVVFSPMSIATVLSMAYGGAKGATATEMADVLRLGTEPGIHASFSDLLSSYEQVTEPTEILLANSIWPSTGFPVRDEYVGLIQESYRGSAQNLDYNNPALAEQTINDWIADNTNDRIKELVRDLSPTTVMVLANALFFQSFWDLPFSTQFTTSSPFQAADGSVVDVEMMSTNAFETVEDHGIRFTSMDGFQVMEMPFRGGAASMVFMLPPTGAASNELPSETLTQINAWAGTPETMSNCIDVKLPKFETTVSTDLSKLLPDMGMPTAFNKGVEPADFTGAFHALGPFIKQVQHQAFVKVDEAGAEASAATVVEFGVCFAAGTPVLTPDGSKPIEDIKVGDFVLSRDEADPEGCVRPKLVEELFGGKAAVLGISVAGQVIRPTETHPFYVRDRGWIPAGELQVGDLLSTHLGEWKPVQAISATAGEVAVFNFRIADYHTYFVGNDENALWAHNCCGPNHIFNANRAFHFSIRDNLNSTTIMMGRIDDPTQTANDLEPGDVAAASESIDASVTSDVPAIDLLRLPSGKSGLAERGEWASLRHDAIEPSVGKDLSVDALVVTLDRGQGRGRFEAVSVDKAMEQESLSLEWVDSLEEANELATFYVG